MQYTPSEAYNNSEKAQLPISQLRKSVTHSEVTDPAVTLALTINFQPETRLMEVVWQRPVSSCEYRQYIRFIGLCIAALRVKFMLIDFSEMGEPSLEDQQNTNAFLNEVKKKSTLIRSARVLAKTGKQQQAYEAVIRNGPVLPYQVSFFYDQAEAKDWLLQAPFPIAALNSSKVTIPLQASLKELKKYTAIEVTENPAKDAQPYKIEKAADPRSAPKITRCQTKFVVITIDSSKEQLQLRWLRRVTSREYRYGTLKAARAVTNYNIRTALINNQQLGTINLEDQAWSVALSVAFLKKSQLERLAIVSSADVMQQMASENMNRRVKNESCPQTIQYFLGEEEAMDWLSLPYNSLQATT